MNELIGKRMSLKKIIRHVSAMCGPGTVSFCEVDPEGLIFEWDNDPKYEPTHVFIDILGKTIHTDSVGSIPLQNGADRVFRQVMTPRMIQFLKWERGD